MSKTLSSAVCETNLIPNFSQENIFLQSLYRLPEEYSETFVRTADSDAPVQVCAIASAQGNDTLAATALQGVMKVLSDAVQEAQRRSVLDFEPFSEQVIASANEVVCQLSTTTQSTPVQVSMTIAILDGNVLRIIHIGNTRAVLIRQGRVIALTEDQTVAHRFQQSGAITVNEERTHEERNNLTHYIGRFSQDGPLLPENKLQINLLDGDEICLLGNGITQGLTEADRDSILIKPDIPESKARSLIDLCLQNNMKAGLSVLILQIEKTQVLPGDEILPLTASALVAKSAFEPLGNDAVLPENVRPAPIYQPVGEDPNTRRRKSKHKRLWQILIPVIVFATCLVAGYFAMMVLFNVGRLSKPQQEVPIESNGTIPSLNKVMYVTSDLVPLYPDKSMTTAPTIFLSRGEVVTLIEDDGSLSKIETTDGNTGFVMTVMLSESDPTIGDALPTMTADPTPYPSHTRQTQGTAPTESTTIPSTDLPTTETVETTPSQTSSTTAKPKPTQTTTTTTSATTTTATTTTTTPTTTATVPTTTATTTVPPTTAPPVEPSIPPETGAAPDGTNGQF